MGGMVTEGRKKREKEKWPGRAGEGVEGPMERQEGRWKGREGIKFGTSGCACVRVRRWEGERRGR